MDLEEVVVERHWCMTRITHIKSTLRKSLEDRIERRYDSSACSSTGSVVVVVVVVVVVAVIEMDSSSYS